MSSIKEVMKNRRKCIRKYINEGIDCTVILNILLMGDITPSAKNRSPWRFSILTGNSKDKVANLMIEYE